MALMCLIVMTANLLVEQIVMTVHLLVEQILDLHHLRQCPIHFIFHWLAKLIVLLTVMDNLATVRKTGYGFVMMLELQLLVMLKTAGVKWRMEFGVRKIAITCLYCKTSFV